MNTIKGKCVFELVKNIDLNDDIYHSLRYQSKINEASKDVLKNMLATLIDLEVEKDNQFWDNVARVAGYKDYEDAEKNNIYLKIDWIQKNITVQKFKLEEL